MNKQRLEAERLIYSVMQALDGEDSDNVDFWKEEFSKMSDEKFKKYISNNFLDLHLLDKYT